MKQKYKELLLEIIEKRLPLCSVYLFGSRAQNVHEPESDIDLALDNNGIKIDTKIVVAIADDISESTIPYFVDVVDLNGLSEDFRKEIEKDLVLWTK
ncbi:MAG: nucleotidyltransferase domain-containing protein [bacterium]